MQTGNRSLYIDNLRWTVILLVISMHAADTYSPLGSWYYTDRHPLSAVVLLIFAAWQTYLQSFFMGLLFFIAGSFVPSSLKRKGTVRFMLDRSFRLGLPLLFYMLILGPFTEYFVAHSWSAVNSSFAREWWRHVVDGEFLSESGPLWFCLALLLFSFAYCAMKAALPVSLDADQQPPKTLTLVWIALLLAVATFLLRLMLPPGFTFLNMRLGDFPQYVLLFSTGILAAHQHWLSKLKSAWAMRWLAICLPLGFTVWLTDVLAGGAMEGSAAKYSGGWYWQSAAMDLWESFTCFTICIGLLVSFRDNLNFQGRLATFLSGNAFAVYVFHPPILVLIARALHEVPWNPLLKLVTLTMLSAVASFTFSAALVRGIPFFRRVF